MTRRISTFGNHFDPMHFSPSLPEFATSSGGTGAKKTGYFESLKGVDTLAPKLGTALPVVDLSRTKLTLKTVVAMYRDGLLGSTELPKKQFED